ncbi:MAG: hypothetical protein ACE5R4_00080 [Armatimonadota bacterium]
MTLRPLASALTCQVLASVGSVFAAVHDAPPDAPPENAAATYE